MDHSYAAYTQVHQQIQGYSVYTFVSVRSISKSSILIQKLILSSADTDNQRVIIKVKDINDEPPYFINRPLPMQVNTLKTKWRLL